MNRTNGELKGMARQMLLGHYQVPMLAMLLSTLIPSLFLLPFNYLCSEREHFVSQAVFYYLASVLIMLIEFLLGTGVRRIHLMIARGEPVRVSDMFWVLQNRTDRILIGSFIFSLITWVGQIPSLLFERMPPDGLSETTVLVLTYLLSLAGLIVGFFLTLPFYFIFWIYIDEPETDTIAAFGRSITLLRGAKWRLFLMELSFIGWTLLGALSLGIGFLWILPYTDQARTNFYLDLKQEFDVKVDICHADHECFSQG